MQINWTFKQATYCLSLWFTDLSLSRKTTLASGTTTVPLIEIWGFPNSKEMELLTIDCIYYFETDPYILKWGGNTFKNRVPADLVQVTKIDRSDGYKAFYVSLPPESSANDFREELESLTHRHAAEIYLEGKIWWRKDNQ